MVLPLWRSLHSLNLMLPKEDRKAMLLRLYNEDTPLMDHSKDRFHAVANAQSNTNTNAKDEVEEEEEANATAKNETMVKGEGEGEDEEGGNVTPASSTADVEK